MACELKLFFEEAPVQQIHQIWTACPTFQFAEESVRREMNSMFKLQDTGAACWVSSADQSVEYIKIHMLKIGDSKMMRTKHLASSTMACGQWHSRILGSSIWTTKTVAYFCTRLIHLCICSSWSPKNIHHIANNWFQIWPCRNDCGYPSTSQYIYAFISSPSLSLFETFGDGCYLCWYFWSTSFFSLFSWFHHVHHVFSFSKPSWQRQVWGPHARLPFGIWHITVESSTRTKTCLGREKLLAWDPEQSWPLPVCRETHDAQHHQPHGPWPDQSQTTPLPICEICDALPLHNCTTWCFHVLITLCQSNHLGAHHIARGGMAIGSPQTLHLHPPPLQVRSFRNFLALSFALPKACLSVSMSCKCKSWESPRSKFHKFILSVPLNVSASACISPLVAGATLPDELCPF